MSDLLNKLDTINVTPTPLPESDHEALAGHHAYFLDTIADLHAAKRDLETLTTSSAWLRRNCHTLLEDLAEAERDTRQKHVDGIIAHFNREHGLNPPHPYELHLDNVPNQALTQRVSDWVLAQLGGRSFLDTATEELRDTFTRRAYHPKRNGRFLAFFGFSAGGSSSRPARRPS